MSAGPRPAGEKRGASRRVEENRTLRALFARAGTVVEDAALRGRLADATSGEDTDLTLSALEAGNAALRALLIELHAHVESLDSPEAAALDEAIWDELAASTERRRFSFAFF